MSPKDFSERSDDSPAIDGIKRFKRSRVWRLYDLFTSEVYKLVGITASLVTVLGLATFHEKAAERPLAAPPSPSPDRLTAHVSTPTPIWSQPSEYDSRAGLARPGDELETLPETAADPAASHAGTPAGAWVHVRDVNTNVEGWMKSELLRTGK